MSSKKLHLDYNYKSHQLQMLEQDAHDLNNITIEQHDNHFSVYWDCEDLLYTGDYFQASAFLQGMQCQKEYDC